MSGPHESKLAKIKSSSADDSVATTWAAFVGSARTLSLSTATATRLLGGKNPRSGEL